MGMLGYLLSGAAEGGSKGINEVIDNRAAEQRKQADILYEARIHDRNRSEKLSDATDVRANASADNATARIQQLADTKAKNTFTAGESAKDRASKASTNKSSSKSDEIKALVSLRRSSVAILKDQYASAEAKTLALDDFNASGSALRKFTGIKPSPKRNEPSMSFADARAQADALYEQKAKWNESDKSQFGHSEGDIKDIWTNEFIKYGRPITGIDGADKGILETPSPGGSKTVETAAKKPKAKRKFKVNKPDGYYTLKNGERVRVKNGVGTYL